MFERVWRFRAAEGKVEEFERAYGPLGEWAQLFHRAPGFLGTELLRAAYAPGEYQVTDRWHSREDWVAFLMDHQPDYERLDARCEGLTALEQLVREGEQ